MPEIFLILLSAGIMLAAALSSPRAVTLQWLRLCGILALTMTALSLFFVFRNSSAAGIGKLVLWCQVGAILGQLAFVQIAWIGTQRLFAAAAAALGISAGTTMLGHGWGWPLASNLGIAGACGLALMTMLLGHAYLTASRMTMAPFARLNGLLGACLIYRTVLAAIAAPVLAHRQDVPMFWAQWGFVIGTRWLVGLIVPAVFVWMTRDCIRRRATQSATGILYVAGVLIFIGEMMALYLVKETGLPF